MRKLNIGCGKDIKEGWINLDMIKNDGVDVVHNLNNYPYPFEDNSIDEIIAINIMEHLDKPNDFIKEIWRITKHNAKIEIETPHFSGAVAWQDITHIRPFSLISLNHYNINRNSRFNVDANPIMFRGYRFIGLSKLAKKFPLFYEKFLTYIFQIAGIRFNLITIKDNSPNVHNTNSVPQKSVQEASP